jgi:ferredoxin
MYQRRSHLLVLVQINSRRCMGSRVCVGIAPDIFQLGTAGYSRVVREVGEADLTVLRDAEGLCPTSSIMVETLKETNGDV